MLKHFEIGHSELYQAIFDNALVGMCLIDEKGQFILVNESMCHCLGYSKDEMLNFCFQDITYQEDIEHSIDVLNGMKQDKLTVTHMEKRYIHKDGDIVWAKINMSKITGSSYILTQVQDITQEKLYERELTKKHYDYELIVNNSSDIIMRHLPNSRAFYVSPSSKDIIGYEPEEMIGTSPYDGDFIHKDDLIHTIESHDDVKNDFSKKLRYRVKHKEGHYIWIETTIKAVYDHDTHEIQELISVSRDCTDQVQIEEEIKQSRQELKDAYSTLNTTLDGITDGLIMLSQEGMYTYINRKAEEIIGRPKSALLGKNIKDILNEYNEAYVVGLYTKAIETQEPLQIELYFKGLKKWLDVRFFPSSKGMAVYISDITERKEMENRLVESEELYRNIVECSSEAIGIHKNGELLFVNNALVEQVGANSIDEVLGKDVMKFLIPEEREKLEKNLEKRMQGLNRGEKENYAVYPYKIKRLDGTIRDFDVTATLVKYKNQTCFQFVARDVTEDNRYKEFLVRSDKLNLVGELAAGVAHEIRNPLTTIKGFIRLLQSNDKDKNRYFFDLIDSEFNRIESIIYEFLTLAKPHNEFKLQRKNINMILQEVVSLQRTNAILKGAIIIFDQTSLDYYVNCDSNSIKQVFINIIQNAIEAVERKGKINIRIKKKNDRVHIDVGDNGCGIPEDRMHRLGEPFYTLKEKGTGLGLMTSFKIIENHGGSIHIQSKEGKGTKVTIKLPSF